MENENGCLGLGYELTDYLLCDGDSLPPLVQQDEKRYEYNQGSSKDCTIYSAIGAISDLFNYEFSKSEIDEIVELSYTKGRVRWQGRYVKNAVKLVADWWNEHQKEKVLYHIIRKSDTQLIHDIIDKNYTICSGFYGNKAMKDDYNSDGVLDWTDWGTTTFWHAINVLKYDGSLACKNSAKWQKYNYFKVKHELNEIKTRHNGAYVYTKAGDNLEEVKRLETLKTKCNVCIEQLWELWHLTNDKNFQSILHYTADKIRSKITDCDNELKKFNPI